MSGYIPTKVMLLKILIQSEYFYPTTLIILFGTTIILLISFTSFLISFVTSLLNFLYSLPLQKIFGFNFTALVISLTDVQIVLQILVLIATLIYTLIRINKLESILLYFIYH